MEIFEMKRFTDNNRYRSFVRCVQDHIDAQKLLIEPGPARLASDKYWFELRAADGGEETGRSFWLASPAQMIFEDRRVTLMCPCEIHRLGHAEVYVATCIVRIPFGAFNEVTISIIEGTL